ncbi:FGGY-family carbohydrate kinase [Deinococcus aestuarii]|uniref:FGGY-family carbohydrate kinase n=1 Tax=Deinococcus aestuarii TaxID=2774531 RepID=UPI001C0CEAB9|nr:FGGY family carbohydrate kinase [Deinococcus aestuarii]
MSGDRVSPAGSCVLAIDQGTSGSKCLLVDAGGEIVARGGAPLSEGHPRPGWVNQDPEEVWQSVRQAVRVCLSHEDPARVLAVGLSTQRESYLLWDRASGEAVSPLISWQDQRTSLGDDLRQPAVAALVRERSGLPLDPMFSASKAAWLLDTYDPGRERSARGELCLGTVDSWLLFKLTGEHLTEHGNASRTQLLNVRTGEWDEELLRLFRVPRAALPEVRSSNGPFPALRGLAPLPDGTPIHAVMGDSHSALFAHGAFTPGAVKATYGTGSSVMGLLEGAEGLDPGLCLTVAWSLDGRRQLAAEGNIRSAGAALRWVAELLNLTPGELADLAATVEDSPVTLVPGFGGLGAPWWDEEAVGLISNLSLGTTRADLAYAAVDSIAQQVADVVEAVNRSAGQLGALYTDGGPTANGHLMQRQADLMGTAVLRSQHAELSALGVAHLAGLGAGLWDWGALRALPRERQTFRPGLDAAARRRLRDRWLAAVDRARLRSSPSALPALSPSVKGL